MIISKKYDYSSEYLRAANGDNYDIITMPFLVAGITDNDFFSLSDKLTAKYSWLFVSPELFISVGGKIHVVRTERRETFGILQKQVCSVWNRPAYIY